MSKLSNIYCINKFNTLIHLIQNIVFNTLINNKLIERMCIKIVFVLTINTTYVLYSVDNKHINPRVLYFFNTLIQINTRLNTPPTLSKWS